MNSITWIKWKRIFLNTLSQSQLIYRELKRTRKRRPSVRTIWAKPRCKLWWNQVLNGNYWTAEDWRRNLRVSRIVFFTYSSGNFGLT